jgi:hypothetical protein
MILLFSCRSRNDLYLSTYLSLLFPVTSVNIRKTEDYEYAEDVPTA